MGKPPKDVTMKLAKAAKAKPVDNLVPLLEKTTVNLSDAAKQGLSKKPKFDDGFLEQQAKRFGTDVGRIRDVADVVESSSSTLEVGETEFSVDKEAQEYFQQLFEAEIRKRSKCNQVVEHETWQQQHNEAGEPVGKPRRIVVHEQCGDRLESIQQALVHQALHLLFDSGDDRTKRSMWNDVRELLYPTKEKSLRGALSTQERRRYLEDHQLKQRLVGRGDRS